MPALQPDIGRETVGLYDGIAVASIVRISWFYRRFIITTMIFAVLVTMLVVGRQEKLFTSTSLVRIHYVPDGQDQRDNSVIADSLVFMSSRAFLSMLAEEQELFDDPEFSLEGAVPLAEDDIGQGFDREHISRNAVLDTLAERIVIAQRGGSHVISVEVTSNDPEKAAQIANTAVDIFREKELSRLEKIEQRHLDWLTGRIRDLRGDIASMEGRALALSSKHGLGELRQDPFISHAASVQRTELTTQLANTKAERAAIQARHENARSWAENRGVDASLAIAKSPALDELRNLEIALERRLSDLGRDLGERHPEIINLKNELNSTRQQMLQEANAVLLSIKGDLLINNAREAEIEAKIESLNQDIMDRQDIHLELQDIEHGINNRQEGLKKLVEKKLRIQESQMVRQGMPNVISPASAQTRHSHPKIWPVVAYASLGTMLLSLLGVFFHDRWVSDFGFTSPRDLEALGINPIGIVPELPGNVAKGATIANDIVEHPHSVEAEAIQRVRNHLSKSRPNDSAAATVVAITSSSPQEGKTTMAVALARQAVIAGSRVLCIDADIRHPGVADLIGLETMAGLSELLSQDPQIEPKIGQDPQTGLHILQAGRCTNSPTDLLSSKEMVRLMEELRKHYDWIFVDSPSIGAVVDGVVLAKHADLVVYVARWLETTRNVVQMGIDRLRNVGVNCTGVALTRVSMISYQKYEQMDEFKYYGYSPMNA